MNSGTMKTNQFRHRHFSMVEVVLGLGLIAFGLISIAALFPVGLRANQAAIGETYAAEHADQFLHLLKAKIVSPEDDQANWTTYAAALPTTKPTSSEPTAESDWSTWLIQGMSTYMVAGSQKQFYRIRQQGLDENDTQFQAVCRVWRTPVTVAHYDGGIWGELTFTSDQAIGLNVEISWPADKPYASRQKSLYQLEVYRPEL